jgi:dipeptidyl aminopeptidase/acylaminoacyl peptidase
MGLLALPERKNPPIAIAIHGFKGTKEYYPFLNNSVKPLTDAGIAMLRIDCRGSGESDLEFKDFTIKSESEDILTAIDYVKKLKDIDSERIALIGVSMGAAAILLAMAKKPKVKTLVFWGPAWYLNDGSRYDTPENRKTVKDEGIFYVTQGFTGKKLIAGKELLQEMTTLDVRPYMKFVEVPVLILRGLRDEIVRIAKDKEAQKALRAEYKTIEKGDHNFTDKESEIELIKLTVDWLNKWLK